MNFFYQFNQIPNYFNFFTTTIKLMGKIKKLKVAYICGQFSKISNYFNSFPIIMKPLRRIKKVKNYMNLRPVYSKSKVLQPLYHSYETIEKD